VGGPNTCGFERPNGTIEPSLHAPPEQTDARVLCLVLTFDAPASLRTCLDSLDAQTLTPDGVIVVDNASPIGIDDIVAEFRTARVERLAENRGPAGGHAAGLRAFLEGDAEFAWVMDDDCRPEPGALAAQVALARSRPNPCVVLSTAVDANTRSTLQGHGWCGVLIPRSVVRSVGLPNEDLFWWTEDTEYLQWRIPNAGFEVCWSEGSRVEIHRRPPDAKKPPWKYYYESRNQVYHRLYVQRAGVRRPIPRHLRIRVRVWRAGRAIAKLGIRALVREDDHRGEKLVMVSRGALDGLRGRLGRTVSVGSSDRPTASS
jgi:rhamnopyranosyl-N-acetylglucosaminyl-diphospho-decaprenol beta-1,3/1,4-galactofuranosyltransferase